MIISKSRLINIIKEELGQVLEEANVYHDPKTGRFSGDPGNGSIYSLSQRGAAKSGIDQEFAGRGTVSKYEKSNLKKTKIKDTPDTDEKPAGRKKMKAGKDISPKYKVGNYPELYKEEDMLGTEPMEELNNNEMLNLSLADLLRIINRAIAGDDMPLKSIRPGYSTRA
jgi:hypothetical protein